MLRDFHYAVRTLLRTPGFTIAALVAFALGIGASTALFSVVEGVLLRSLPYPGAARLVDVKSATGTSSYPLYEAWRSAPGIFEDAAAAIAEQPVLRLEHGPERVSTWIVTGNFFSLLGARPLLGPGFSSEDDRPDGAALAILSNEFWRSHFGADPQVLGRTLTLDSVIYTIAGVFPAGIVNPVGFKHSGDPDVWLNLGSFRARSDARDWLGRPGFWVIGRLRHGVTTGQAAMALDLVAKQRGVAPVADQAAQRPLVAPLHESLVANVRTALLLMLGAVALVVLVACANVATLLLCRAVAREHEVAVRVALGASRGRLIREVLTESILLALIGGALGVLLAIVAVPILVRLAGTELPRIADIGLNGRVLIGALTVSVLAGLIAGVVPALRAAQQRTISGLRAASPAGMGRQWRQRATDVFIVAQVAITLMLLSGAGVLVKSFIHLIRSNPGFDGEHLLTVDLQLPDKRYASPVQMATFASLALERVRELPGIRDAAVATGRPLEGYTVGPASQTGGTALPGSPFAWISAVTPEYFRTLDIPLKRGELFAATQLGTSTGVVVDEAAARAYFPGVDALGRSITFYGNRARTVIGIVGDAREMNLYEAPPPHIYQSLADDPASGLKILVRTAQAPDYSIQLVRRAVQSIDATVPIDRVVSLRELMSASVARQRFYAVLVLAFAILGLLLAASGVFGITAYGVTQRTREIGIRMALGANRASVVELVLGHGLRMVVSGLVVGLVAALFATQVLRSLLFEVGPRDPVTIATVALLLLIAALVACYLPARRAVRVDPIVALRSD